jgi:toxin YoeB
MPEKFLTESTDRFQEDYKHWTETNQRLVNKINSLMLSVEACPSTGIGKPEPLRHQLQGCWSRRINSEHRLIYRVEGNMILFLSCRGHYT